MSLSLVEQLKQLETIQEFDLKIDQLKKAKDALPVALKNLDDGLKKSKSAVDLKQVAYNELEKAERQTQAALDLNRDRLGRSTSRLEGVQNSQEYSAVNKEIDQLKKQNSTLEEQSKKARADMDALQAEIKDLTGKLESSQKERDSQAEKLSGEGGQIQAQIDALMADRSKLTPNIERQILSLYDRVRGARAGLGIVPAVGGRCKGCNMVVPPQQFNEIQRGRSLQNCPSCHRILFFPEAPAQGNAEAKV